MEKELTPYITEAQRLYNSSKAFATRADYYNARKNNTIDDKMILYEAFYGRGITCNPGALFRYLVKDSRFSDFTHVIVLEESDLREKIMAEFEGNDKVKFVVPFTQEYFVYLSKAKYLINNSTWQYYFAKKPGQVIVNTWHGIPLKNLGYDVPDGNIHVANVIRNMLMTDYLISPVEFTTDNFRHAFKLEGIFPGKIIETGYPRIDNTLHPDRDLIERELKVAGVNYDKTKKLILYAPTWRGVKFSTPDVEIDKYNKFIETIYKHVDKNEYQVLFKPHQIVYKSLAEKGLLQDNYVPATVNTNALLGITDILISDYSSIFFDFLVTDKPLIFYVPDLEFYEKERGLYFPVENLPGPVSDDLEQIARWCGDIENYSTFFDFSKYAYVKEKYTKNDDGNVCERVVNAVFFGDESNTISLKNNKIKILFHTDCIKVNGISYSVLNLMNHLDYDKYDITFFAIGANNAKNYVNDINPNVRVLCRVSPKVVDIEDEAKTMYCIDNAITEEENPELYPSDFYNCEFKRSFGDVKFDYLINFSGFNAFWTNIYLSQKDTKKIIWMHSVIMKEYNRCVNGKYIFKREMDNIFKAYKHYDKYVSCSYTTMLENKKDLSTPENEDRFAYANNLISIERTIPGCINMEPCTFENKNVLAFSTSVDSNKIFLVPKPDKNNINFVTVGRLSPEKNHENLIKGFARLYKENENVRLYIIGNGPLCNDTRNLIRKLGLTGKVILTGNLNDPFTFMRYCDCFILSSFYEGQSMVLQEARAVNLAIIATKFPAVKDSIKPDGQLIIEFEEENMYEGMKAFTEGKVPNKFKFDLDEFNKQAIDQFEACLN